MLALGKLGRTTPRPDRFTSWNKTPYLSNGRLDGRQRRSGWVLKFLLASGIECPTTQPVANHWTACAAQPKMWFLCTLLNKQVNKYLEQSSSWEANSSSTSPRNYAQFTETKGSLPCSQEPVTCSYPGHESQALWNISWQATFLQWAPHPTHTWGTTSCLLPATTYSIHSQLPSIVGAVPPSATWGSPYCGDGGPLITVSAVSVNYKYLLSICPG